MEKRITIITLGVSDMQRSIRFYRDGLGLGTIEEAPDDAGIVFFEMGGVALALYPRQALAEDVVPGATGEGSGFPGFTLAHNVRSKEEVHAVIEEVRSIGAKIIKEPQDVFWGGYSSYFADPDGYLWEVAYNPFREI